MRNWRVGGYRRKDGGEICVTRCWRQLQVPEQCRGDFRVLCFPGEGEWPERLSVIAGPCPCPDGIERSAQQRVSRVRRKDRGLPIPLGHFIGNCPRNEPCIAGVRLKKTES